MNKRSAIAIAGGVTGALISGVAGYSIRIHQPLVAASADPSKPIVKTETRTITIHRKANPKKKDPALVVRRVRHSPLPGYFLAVAVHQTGGSSVVSGQQETEHEEDEGGGYESD